MNKPYYEEPNQTLYCGHALEVLKEIPAESVDMVMTSPPYWGLRTYKTEPQIWGDNHCEHQWTTEEFKQHSGRGDCQSSKKYSEQEPVPDMILKRDFCLKCNAWRGELGLEPTIELYISHLIQIFDEVKRVLKKTGTCWVNIDDSYAANRSYQVPDSKGCDVGNNMAMVTPKGISPKSLCLIPERFAIAMVEQGWILRNDIVWNKPNPMPESAKDRFTGSWEHLFFFTKNNQALYWTNSKTFKITGKHPLGTHGAENEDWEWIEHSACKGKGCNNKRCINGKIKSSLWEGHDYWFEQQFEPQSLDTHSRGTDPKETEKFIEQSIRADGTIAHKDWLKYTNQWLYSPLGRNKRDVWEITTQPYPEAHFATFPEKLCEIPILAGCPGAICKKCGKAREKIYEMERPDDYDPSIIDSAYQDNCRKASGAKATSRPLSKIFKDSLGSKRIEGGYTECGCNAGFEPGVVLDPFAGSGATGAVAKKLGRKYIGIDLSPAYCKLHVKRLQGISLPMVLV